jgi:hypothetical protein
MLFNYLTHNILSAVACWDVNWGILLLRVMRQLAPDPAFQNLNQDKRSISHRSLVMGYHYPPPLAREPGQHLYISAVPERRILSHNPLSRSVLLWSIAATARVPRPKITENAMWTRELDLTRGRELASIIQTYGRGRTGS